MVLYLYCMCGGIMSSVLDSAQYMKNKYGDFAFYYYLCGASVDNIASMLDKTTNSILTMGGVYERSCKKLDRTYYDHLFPNIGLLFVPDKNKEVKNLLQRMSFQSKVVEILGWLLIMNNQSLDCVMEYLDYSPQLKEAFTQRSMFRSLREEIVTNKSLQKLFNASGSFDEKQEKISNAVHLNLVKSVENTALEPVLVNLFKYKFFAEPYREVYRKVALTYMMDIEYTVFKNESGKVIVANSSTINNRDREFIFKVAVEKPCI